MRVNRRRSNKRNSGQDYQNNIEVGKGPGEKPSDAGQPLHPLHKGDDENRTGKNPAYQAGHVVHENNNNQRLGEYTDWSGEEPIKNKASM